MKKSRIILITVSTLALLSCSKKPATETKKSNSTQNTASQTINTGNPVLDKQLFAINNIGKMMVENNLEGALYRMDGAYRLAHNNRDFAELWNSATEGLGKVKDFTINTESYENLDFYKFIDVSYNFDSTSVYARYFFSGTSVMPVNVDFMQEKPKTPKIGDKLALKDIFADYFKIGCGLNGAVLDSSAITKPQVMELAKQEFSSCTMTNLMKPVYVLNQQESMKNYVSGNKEPVLRFGNIDKTLKFCMENNLPVRGHTLIWHTQTPDWFFKEGYKNDGKLVDRKEMISRMESFIRQYMTYVQETYPNTVYCWDVVNEAVDPENGDENSLFKCRMQNDNGPVLWYQTIGNDYPELAFTFARQYAAPGVKLFYNDYGTINSEKQMCIYNLCSDLKNKNLIDGIGLQGYWDINYPSLSEIENAINIYAELGLEIQLTEWSISAKDNTDESFNAQAERYASVFKLLQKLDTQGGGKANITCVSGFGVIDEFNPGDTTNSRWFNKNGEPKPAYYAIKDTGLLWY